ncbi:MAG: DUF58 domain-containing protein [Proteobacteria bacterium]|nr:DUF58 domain-containing protein [Pseudomonadota bacterium]
MRAEALAARLPPLLVAAERVAATVAQGVHGRRRVGQGDSFWQFRPFLPGDAVARVDWRQSAKSGRPAPEGWFVRETEWEAAQTVCLWRDASASMRWHSRLGPEDKRDRAGVLLLALASLLLRAGERVAMIEHAPAAGGRSLSPVQGRAGLERLADALARAPDDDTGIPAPTGLPRHATVVLVGDFLAPLPEIQAGIARLAAVPARGHLLQVLDPAEASLPYEGRVRFRGLEREADTLIPRVEGVRAAYADRLAAQQDGLAAIAKAAGFGFSVHQTGHPPEVALLGLYTALAVR